MVTADIVDTRRRQSENGTLSSAEGYPSGQRGQTVNLLVYTFVGSNPTPSTINGWLAGGCGEPPNTDRERFLFTTTRASSLRWRVARGFFRAGISRAKREHHGRLMFLGESGANGTSGASQTERYRLQRQMQLAGADPSGSLWAIELAGVVQW